MSSPYSIAMEQRGILSAHAPDKSEFQILGAISTCERASVDFQLGDLRTWKDFMKRYEKE